MMSSDRNTLLTSVEAGDAMANMFKRYWLPVGRSEELQALAGDPVPVRVLGENYILWRDGQGRLGLLDEHCAHRRASLALGRVEPDGIRCIYHGWKFAADGTVLDLPNVPDCRNIKNFRQPAFPVREAGGTIWAYLGPAEHEPPFPDYEFMHAPHVRIEATYFPVNYAQAMEGLLDSSHLGFLHADIHSRGITDATGSKPMVGSIPDQFIGVRAPKIKVRSTEWGFRYAAMRPIEVDGEPVVQARVTACFMPSCCLTSADNVMQFGVPIDTHNTLIYFFFWSFDEENGKARIDKLADQLGLHRDRRYAYGRTDMPGRDTLYGQDRAAMREGRSFTGLPSVFEEDIAVVHSMGTVTDRSKENLVESDLPIATYRRLLVENARAVAEGGPARGVSPKTPPTSGEASLKPGERWEAMFDDWAED